MEDYINTNTSNINERWLQNIYENIKKLEEYERLVREGCTSIMDYFQIPLEQRDTLLGLTQYKNLKFFLTEFRLLLADLSPILDSERVKHYDKTIKSIDSALKTKNVFIKQVYSANRELIRSEPTEFFYTTIDLLHDLKIVLFREIKHILYIG